MQFIGKKTGFDYTHLIIQQMEGTITREEILQIIKENNDDK